MTLIKVSNHRLRFEQPIALNPEKKYKLRVNHMIFSLDTAIGIMFKIEIMIYTKDIVPEGHVASFL
jgi:hypothetical protein